MKKRIMNFLFCSAGRRCELIKNCRQSLQDSVKIVATDCSKYAPALYFADEHYIVPRIDDPTYIEKIISICKREEIDVITTFIDPEIEILAKYRFLFEEIGVEVLAPLTDTAQVCFDKYKLFKHAIKNNIPTVPTYSNLEEFSRAYESGSVNFPVFVKPRTGSGSVGVRKVEKFHELKRLLNIDCNLIIQKFMNGIDIDVDIYIDTISKEVVRVFSKNKIETKIGGASKTISFKDKILVNSILKINKTLNFNGPVDIDFFYADGIYYLSEINPRFGGAYLHAYGAGVDFFECVVRNLQGIKNNQDFYSYDNDVVMMMYDSVVILKGDELDKRKVEDKIIV